VQSKLVIQSWPGSLRLDFFPTRANAAPTKLPNTELVASEAKLTSAVSTHDIRFYVQCDCACK